jgi:chromosome segregation protein
VHFNKLHLSGFKSFVDPTEFVIEPGLTGIVGPNGCGKSNLIEALRWVMGETSAKKMRGGAMDDVIFSGSSGRPARNFAEVALFLDNAERSAPAPYNTADELEVRRRIERETGSLYTINGSDVRARDVQRLFADLATGAHATALVGQGEIGRVINSKPSERRSLLEEASGITGLHSRRHEAELRLRAAESNLERLDDVMQAMDTQLKGLQRQARQATRYRNLSSHIRKAQALLFFLRWTAAETECTRARARLTEAEQKVADATREAVRTTTAESEAAERVPALRDADAAAAARAHQLSLARERLDEEERRAEEQIRQLAARLAQIDHDIERERSHTQDATARISAISGERNEIVSRQGSEQAALDAAKSAVDGSTLALEGREKELETLTERVARDAANREKLTTAAQEARGQIERLEARVASVRAERDSLAAEQAAQPGEGENATEVDAARTAVAACNDAVDRAAEARSVAGDREGAARDALQASESEFGRIEAESDALGALLSVNADDLWPPLVDAVTVDAGYETAVGTALGDDLAVSSDTGAPVHWRALPPIDQAPELPGQAAPLSRYVRAPAVLDRRLAQIGVVPDEETGNALRGTLKPGQRLVTREGALWRWDGYTVRSGAPTTAATRLSQRNRLRFLGSELTRLSTEVDAARAAFETARAEARAAADADGAARAAAREAADRLQEIESRLASVIEARARRESRIAALDDALATLAGEIADWRTRRDDADREFAALPNTEADREAVATMRQEIGTLRQAMLDARAASDRVKGEAAARRSRVNELDRDEADWRKRLSAADTHLRQLADRRRETEAEHTALLRRPGEIAAQRSVLLDHITDAETARKSAADDLATAEKVLSDCRHAARVAQATQGEAREARVREEGHLTQSEQVKSDIARSMIETIECSPTEVRAVAELSEDADLPAEDAVESRLERLKRERENIGPVNLRADAEAEEVGEQLDSMRRERTDLESAIARLRQGIASLNREGRERMLAAFTKVDAHFRELFCSLFGGGQAHLALTESDDPLEAGLEIMASPPGKRLQVMSLLSGGEQALTALSLLFAVFLTNPAPVCVLDEVDAPLDDANVDRFLDLVAKIATTSATRFLIVTHNPQTMARMDRLYGVTMAERGISQIVSVDLSVAERLRATA